MKRATCRTRMARFVPCEFLKLAKPKEKFLEGDVLKDLAPRKQAVMLTHTTQQLRWTADNHELSAEHSGMVVAPCNHV